MKTTIIISTAALATAAIAAGVIAAFGQQWLWQWQDSRTPLCIHGVEPLTPGNAKYYGCKLP